MSDLAARFQKMASEGKPSHPKEEPMHDDMHTALRGFIAAVRGVSPDEVEDEHITSARRWRDELAKTDSHMPDKE